VAVREHRGLVREVMPRLAGCHQQEMPGEVTASQQHRPSRRRERNHELRQAPQVRAAGSGENVAPRQIGDDRIPVT